MTDPDKAVRELMKDVGKTLRPMGFRGSVSCWTQVTPNGRVMIGRSKRNNWTKAKGYTFGVRGFAMGCEAIPVAWWQYQNWRSQRDGGPELDLSDPELPGINLLDQHGLPREPVSPTRVWTIRPETEVQNGTSVSDEDFEFCRRHLSWAVEQLARRALDLIEPGRYLKELLNQPEKEIGDWEPIVVLLAEYGPSSALDGAIEQLQESYAARDAEAATEVIVEYARSR